MEYEFETEESSLIHTTEEHTKFSIIEDEFVAEDQMVWFS